jgi:hypothetical protein
VVTLHIGNRVMLSGPRCVRGHGGETTCAPILMTGTAPPAPAGIERAYRRDRISRMA